MRLCASDFTRPIGWTGPGLATTLARMSSPVRRQLLFSVALALVATTALGPVPTAQGKKAICKGGKVPVTVGKRTACKPPAKALPKPRSIDPMLAQLQEALKLDVSKAGGRRAKRFRSLETGFGAAGRRAQRKLLKALPKALALIEKSRGSSRPRSGLATASACGARGPVDPVGNVGGVGVGVAGNNGGQMTVSSSGQTYRMRFSKCGSPYLYVAGCPTASGEAKTKTTNSYEITEEVLEGDRVVSRSTTSVENKVSALGKVASDAKLDHIDVDVSQETFIVASGGLVLRGTTDRHARVNMRGGGGYDPANASVKASGDAKAKDGETSFASAVAEAIEEFRAAESGGSFLHTDGWSTFNRQRGAYCAKAVFSPESNTLKLRKGKSGQVSIYAKGEDGGRATGARWNLLNPENADFSPGSSQDPAPSVSYTVKNAPQNGFVKVTVKFTSTAGVGEDTWTQPTEKGPTINRIAGTFSLRSDLLGSVIEWAGNTTFDRFTPAIFGGASGSFKFKEGFLTATASGNGTLLSAPLCSQRGSTQLAFSSGSEFAVLGSGVEQLEPYQYSFSLSSSNLPLPMLTIELFNCDPVAEEQEGFYEYPASFLMAPNGFYESPDGIAYSGSETQSQSSATVTETWSFLGTE